jgi:hypothetical protein
MAASSCPGRINGLASLKANVIHQATAALRARISMRKMRLHSAIRLSMQIVHAVISMESAS